ncbi:MAG: DnaD domain protein [Erysipelotrichaceae bacterium]|nr:DnaD domain protein [Erysipelotrichaceae bacterium]
MIPEALDFRYLLAEYYKRIGIEEVEFVVITMIDHFIQQGNELITPDLLSLKMNLSPALIDQTIVRLMNKGLVDYTYASAKTGALSTSLQPLKRRLYREFQLDLADKEKANKVDITSQLENIFGVYQKELGRSLSPAETQRIREWFAYGYSEQMIIDALFEALSKNRRSIRSIDKILLQWATSEDIEKEGFSIKQENWDEDIDKTIEIAKKKWFDFDDE